VIAILTVLAVIFVPYVICLLARRAAVRQQAERDALDKMIDALIDERGLA
jgi:hypothetical protein